jgi:hypothetical protein
MSAVIVLLLGVVIMAGVVYDTVHLITPYESRCPPLARLRGKCLRGPHTALVPRFRKVPLSNGLPDTPARNQRPSSFTPSLEG